MLVVVAVVVLFCFGFGCFSGPPFFVVDVVDLFVGLYQVGRQFAARCFVGVSTPPGTACGCGSGSGGRRRGRGRVGGVRGGGRR